MAPRAAKTQALAKIKQHYSSNRRQTLSPSLWSNLPNDLARIILKMAMHENKKDNLIKMATKLIRTCYAHKRQYDVLKRRIARLEALRLHHNDPLMHYELWGNLMDQKTEILGSKMNPVLSKFSSVLEEMRLLLDRRLDVLSRRLLHQMGDIVLTL